jgi:aspartyl-tRNA(Asn)/glutamyl-tRNA(Gln) amidotransferase subunit A
MNNHMDNNKHLTIASLAPLLRQKKISPVELTKFFLDRISRLQPVLNAYITVVPEIALAQARRAEREITKGRYRGVLHGIPINIKDLFFTKGIRTTAGSGVLQKFIPDRNAAVVSRLLDAGCILLGKTNMHEFAFGSTNVHSYFGPVRNPWDTNRISGGSSGGSAASLVTGQAVASFGTDTGGSIRIPAAACGCVGFKPSYGRISLEGVIPLSPTLDHAGPLARCVLDAALLYDAFARLTLFNSASGQVIRKVRKGIRNFAIGVPRQYFFDRIHPEVRSCVIAAIQVLQQLGARIREVNLQGTEETARIAAEITGCEALAFHEMGLRKKSRQYGDDVRSRLEQSRGLTATAYIQSVQRRLVYSQEFDRALGGLDLIAAPTLPIPAPHIDENEAKIGRSREDIRLAMLRLTRPGNLSGLPAISIPCGFTRDHLPVGLQLIGRRYDELSVFRAAHAYEKVTPWHECFPGSF